MMPRVLTLLMLTAGSGGCQVVSRDNLAARFSAPCPLPPPVKPWGRSPQGLGLLKPTHDPTKACAAPEAKPSLPHPKAPAHCHLRQSSIPAAGRRARHGLIFNLDSAHCDMPLVLLRAMAASSRRVRTTRFGASREQHTLKNCDLCAKDLGGKATNYDHRPYWSWRCRCSLRIGASLKTRRVLFSR